MYISNEKVLAAKGWKDWKEKKQPRWSYKRNHWEIEDVSVDDEKD